MGWFSRLFRRVRAQSAKILQGLILEVYGGRETFDAARLSDEYLAFAEELRPFVCNTTTLLHKLRKADRRILFEGAQGSLLDIDHGTYPYVTSSSAGGGVPAGAGVPMTCIQSVPGVVKAYATRVGAGPFPTELKDALGETLRERGHEYGTTTGRPRRCGWFDAVAASYATMFTGPTHLALLHLDTLAGLETVKVCVAYKHSGALLEEFPSDAHMLEKVEPVYATMAGWTEELGECRHFGDLPAAARDYVRLISERLGAPVHMIGVGPSREQMVLVGSEV